MHVSIAGWIDQRAHISGRRQALSDPFTSLTYGELARRCAGLAEGLRDLGVRPGDRVAVLLHNGTQFLELQIAAARLGAILVPLNYRLAAPELEFILGDAAPRVLFHHSEFADAATAAADGSPVSAVVDCGSGTEGSGRDRYEALVGGQGEAQPAVRVGADDIALMMYTSGTTGRPKGAMLSHGNVLWNAVQTTGRVAFHREDRLLIVAPMFHIGGLGIFALPGLYIGATLEILPAFDPVRVLETIAERRVTAMFGVPAMWQAIMAELERADRDLDSVHLFMTGGAPCPLPVLRFFQQRGIRFVEGFGLTETAPTVSVLDPEDAERKNGSVGYPALFTELAIVDAEERTVPPGEAGELLIRGPQVFQGYWNRPRATEEALRGDWFHTGDMAYIDDEGFLYIVDRKKDMLISGGENVYPAEVEQVLHEHPGVADVAVIGVADPRWQEVPRAVVVRRPDAEVSETELIEFCRERLARFKVPKSVVFVAELPRSATGKILKRELRDSYGGEP